MRFRALASGLRGKPRKRSAVSCRHLVSGVSAGVTPSSSIDPDLVLRERAAEAVRSGAWVLLRSSVPSRKRLGSLSQSAGPACLKSRFSPDFRAAVSLGLLTFAPNAVDGKRPISPRCAPLPPGRCTSLCTSVGGR